MSVLESGGSPQTAQTNYKLLRVPPGGKLRFTCLSEVWVNVQTHWNGKGTDLCPRTEECLHCRSGIRQIWKAYVIGESTTSRELRVIELTQLAAFDLAGFQWRADSLVGAIIVLTRRGKAINGPLEATIDTWHETLNEKRMDVLEHCILTIYRQHVVFLDKEKIFLSPKSK